jgi:methionyl-tRNA formyltransferase
LEKIKYAIIGEGERFLKCLHELSSENLPILVGPTETKFHLSANLVFADKFEVFVRMLHEANVSYVFCVGFGSYVNSKFFKTGNARWINFHASNIPFYRGGSPMNWAIINGEEYSGITMLEMTSGLDVGPVILKKKYSIIGLSYDQVKILADNYAPQLLKKFISDHHNLWKNRKPQNLHEGSHFTTRVARDSKICFHKQTDEQIMRYIQALPHPLPLPFFIYQEKKVEIVSAKILINCVMGPAGRIAGLVQNKFTVIAQNRGIHLELLKVDGQVVEPNNFLITGGDIG